MVYNKKSKEEVQALIAEHKASVLNPKFQEIQKYYSDAIMAKKITREEQLFG